MKAEYRGREYCMDPGNQDIFRYVARTMFAWPGGYDMGVVYEDGDVICSYCARDRYRIELRDIRDGLRVPQGIMVGDSLEPGDCLCDNCYRDLAGCAD